MLIFETEILKFRFYLVESKTICQRCVNVESLTCNLVLFAWLHALKSSHVVQTVSNLDEYDAYVIIHGQQQLLKILCLGRCLIAEYSARNLGQTVYNLRYLGTENILYVIGCVICVFNHIMQKCRAD